MPKSTKGHSAPQVEKIPRYSISELIYMGTLYNVEYPSHSQDAMIFIGSLIAQKPKEAHFLPKVSRYNISKLM